MVLGDHRDQRVIIQPLVHKRTNKFWIYSVRSESFRRTGICVDRPRICHFAPAAMENPGVPRASGSVRAHPYVSPGQAWLGTTSKAPQVQSRRLDCEPEAVRTKFHGATEPPYLYRDQNVRRSPAYLKPDEGIWDQSYLQKLCSK